jgi:long-chain acyl-CoA synthetase
MLGAKEGDRVAVLMRNDIEFVEITIGIGMGGAVPVPINWHWKGNELGYLLADCRATVVFAHSDLLGVLEDVCPPDMVIIEVEPSEALRAAYPSEASQRSGRYPIYESWLPAKPTGGVTTSSPPPMSVIYTSGTTGRPKGILRARIRDEDRTGLIARFLQTQGLEPGMSTLIAGPLYHAAPNVHAVFALSAGLSVTILPRFTAEGFLSTVQTHRIEQAHMVPTMFVRLLQLPEEVRAAFDVSSLRAVVHAAAPCPGHLKRRMIEWLGPIVLEYYGGSETGAVVACDSAEWLAHPGTVGRPLEGAGIRIYADDGMLASAGMAGQIYLKPAPGWPDFTYEGDEAKRRAIERDGYLTIGDIGFLDEDNFLHLCDRANDMVISGGVNIYPAEIEQCLAAMPGIRDVAVFGIPDEEYGESLAAHVDTDPVDGPSEEEIRAYVRRNLASYKTPKVVVIDRTLPREESGKLLKRRISQRYRDEFDARNNDASSR